MKLKFGYVLIKANRSVGPAESLDNGARLGSDRHLITVLDVQPNRPRPIARQGGATSTQPQSLLAHSPDADGYQV